MALCGILHVVKGLGKHKHRFGVLLSGFTNVSTSLSGFFCSINVIVKPINVATIKEKEKEKRENEKKKRKRKKKRKKEKKEKEKRKTKNIKKKK